MPETRDLPLARWGEQMRRDRQERRSRHRILAAAVATAAAAGASTSTLFWHARPVLVWNASESSPVGLYRVRAAKSLRSGDMVVAWPPSSVRALAAARGYLPSGVPLVKRVAAAQGDTACAAGAAIFVNGRLEALRALQDGFGRPLPWWTGCKSLMAGELLLIAPGVPASFDGRYFGTTEASDVVGRATLLWRR
jgi:conjugative transfer signal peptidase TraF